MCLNPVHRQRVCEKLYHKMGYEWKKKNWLKKGSMHGFDWCLPVVWPLFRSPSFSFFSLSLCLSLGLIRPAVEPGPPGKRSRVWLELRLNWGGWWWWWGCKLGGENFRPFSQCNTARSLERWQAAGCSLPSVFFPFTPPLTSFPSYFSCSPLLHPSPFPLMISNIHRLFFSSFSYSSSCCPPFHGGGCGKLTLSLFNDAFQTSAQWHHNKSRTSLWVISLSKDNHKWPSASRRLLRDTASGPDLFPSFDRSLTRARAALPGWDHDVCVCVCLRVCIRLCVSAGDSSVGGCFSSE